MKKNIFPQQTHFIGVLLPEHIRLTLEHCRRHMNESYGCKSGYGTPVHITLIPPFKLPENYSTEDLAQAIINEVLPKKLAFKAHFDNFDAFADRTIFAKVLSDENWTKVRDETFKAIVKFCPGCTKADKRPFKPHGTVANRDIPEGASTKALKFFNEMGLTEDFLVDNITVFERKHGKWAAEARIEL